VYHGGSKPSKGVIIMNDTNFIGYEYTSITVKNDLESAVVDGYANFGWKPEGREATLGTGSTGLKFKRDRKIRNKAELSRLQREFITHIKEIESLEASKTSGAQIAAFTIGFVGTAFLAGATFSYLAGFFPLMIILAIPGFIGWILPYFVYNGVRRKKTTNVSVLIENQYDAIYEICEKANGLLVV